MSERSAQKTTVLGALMMTSNRREDRGPFWCQECGRDIGNIAYNGDFISGKLVFTAVCDECLEEMSFF